MTLIEAANRARDLADALVRESARPRVADQTMTLEQAHETIRDMIGDNACISLEVWINRPPRFRVWDGNKGWDSANLGSAVAECLAHHRSACAAEEDIVDVQAVIDSLLPEKSIPF